MPALVESVSGVYVPSVDLGGVPTVMEAPDDRIALIDMDGTVVDLEKALRDATDPMRAPGEPPFQPSPTGWRDYPQHIEARRNVVKKIPGFWRTLPRLEMGFDIIEELRALGFGLHVLTKGPSTKTHVWGEKVDWCREHLPDATVTVTEIKTFTYGRVFVEDFPDFFEPWLVHRPRGLVIAIAQPWNAHVDHPNVLRYDGTNRRQIREALKRAYDRPGRS